MMNIRKYCKIGQLLRIGAQQLEEENRFPSACDGVIGI